MHWQDDQFAGNRRTVAALATAAVIVFGVVVALWCREPYTETEERHLAPVFSDDPIFADEFWPAYCVDVFGIDVDTHFSSLPVCVRG